MVAEGRLGAGLCEWAEGDTGQRECYLRESHGGWLRRSESKGKLASARLSVIRRDETACVFGVSAKRYLPSAEG